MTREKREDLVFLPLGGANEIGMNCYLYGLGDDVKRQWLMVDLGVTFADEEAPGVDLILPDLRYIEEERRNLCGIVLTHAHEDHIGALPWLWSRLNVPVYCTPFTAALLRRKLEASGIVGEVDIRVLPPRSRFQAGPFDLELVPVHHSIPEACALVVKTSAGTLVHSGDWKIDREAVVLGPPMDEARFQEIGTEGVDVLVCDSTNVLKEGRSPSEKDVVETLSHIFKEASGRVVLTTFASHVGRLNTVCALAQQYGRDIVVAGRAMWRIIEAAQEIGLLKSYIFHNDDAFDYLPRQRALLLCTGSQGEPRAAMARIAKGTHPRIALDEGDVVIFSSRSIPGNEKAIGRIVNGLSDQGVEVITSDDALVHTSGHPRQGELLEMYGWLKPKILIPMHGEPHHTMRHREFALSCGIPVSKTAKNGEILKVLPGSVELIDDAPCGTLHVDGHLIVPSLHGPARHRRKLSFAGAAILSVTLDGRGHCASEPLCVLDGIPEFCAQGTAMEEHLLDMVDRVLDGLPKARRLDDRSVVSALKDGTRRVLENHWGKKPVCHVLLHRV